MRTLLRVIFYDILLALVYTGFDAYLIYFYFSNGDKWWGAATVSAVFLPGLLEFLCYTYCYFHGDLEGSQGEQIREYIFWTVFSMFYPISLVIWHIYHICKGENNFLRYETIARSRVLTSLSALTKSALQLVLQTTILMITWGKIGVGYRVYILVSALFNSWMLAKSSTDHHYFESSAKNVRVRTPYCQMVRRLFFTHLHVLLRGFVISLLASYLHFVSIAFIGLMVTANYITANILIKSSSGSKHFWTAFAAVVVPTCFVSRDSVVDKHPQQASQVFTRFYKWNSVLFFLIFGVAALAAADCLLLFTNVNKFTCSNLPFLSHDSVSNCPPGSSFKDNLPGYSDLVSILPPPHTWFYIVGNLMVLLLSLLHLVIVSMEEKCCAKDYHPVSPM